jgi:hypothetical protein
MPGKHCPCATRIASLVDIGQKWKELILWGRNMTPGTPHECAACSARFVGILL